MKSESTCMVSASDYAIYFIEGGCERIEVIQWDGIDRRVGVADRRANAHDRRWEQARGRRFNYTDRRRRNVMVNLPR